MRPLLSRAGAVLALVYAVLALWAREEDLNSSPWMMRNFWSDVVSAPGRLLVLKPIGFDVTYSSSRQYLVSICISVVLVYLVGALLDLFIRALRDREET